MESIWIFYKDTKIKIRRILRVRRVRVALDIRRSLAAECANRRVCRRRLNHTAAYTDDEGGGLSRVCVRVHTTDGYNIRVYTHTHVRILYTSIVYIMCMCVRVYTLFGVYARIKYQLNRPPVPPVPPSQRSTKGRATVRGVTGRFKPMQRVGVHLHVLCSRRENRVHNNIIIIRAETKKNGNTKKKKSVYATDAL